MRLGLAVKGILLGMVVALLGSTPALASEFHGQVVFGGLPVPGAQASVTATQGDKTVTAITDDQGLFGFPDLADGAWNITITMTGFAPIKESITVAPNSPIPVFELKIETLAQIREEAKPIKVEPGAAPVVATAPAAEAGGAGAAKGSAAAGKKPQQAADNSAPAPPAQEASAPQSPDGFLINGSVNNAATSQFSLAQAFGNSRNSRSLYTYQGMFQFNSSTLDAQQYSITGLELPKAPYQNFVTGVQVSGPLKIPHLLPAYRAPTFYVGYQHAQQSNVTIQQTLVPTTAQEGAGPNTAADLSTLPGVTQIYAPMSGLQAGCPVAPGAAFAGNKIPWSCISPVATALLKFYPAPNVTGLSQYNFQTQLTGTSVQDQFSVRLQKSIGNKDNLSGTYALSSTRATNPNLFGFVDSQNNLGQSVGNQGSQLLNWYHRFTQRLSGNISYGYSRQRSDTTIAFENKQNVSQAVGISGNLQDAANWGPPALNFAQSGIAALSDGTSRNNRNQTQMLVAAFSWNRFRHEMQFGGDFTRQEWNYFQQSNPRGTLSFTGLNMGTGSDFADFLLGLPDTSQIAYGNADKYLRQSIYNLYANDNFRVSPELTVSFGMRWEYGAPVTETKDRLVNLDFTKNFTQQAPVLATNSAGTYSGQRYPNSLVRPDKIGFAPQVGIAWRPISGSSLLVTAGYSLRHDTSVYQQMAYAMATQTPGAGAPWSSTSLSIAASGACPLPIAMPFLTPGCASSSTATDTFAVDPDFRVGYAQVWKLTAQRDLPAALQMQLIYTGTKGTRGVQEILPNTYPFGGTDPCVSCPKNFFYRMSNGNSTYEAGEVVLRRRLRAGLSASADYTFSKALDDDYSYGGAGGVASAGSAQVAQDWRHPEAQRGLSTFDQRHRLILNTTYTTGVGLGGHALMSGWRGLIYKEWTISTAINMGSGLPETPTYFAALPGTAYTGILRGNYVGGAVHLHQPGLFLNPAAFTAPTPGQFGTAARDSITGPSQFGLNASMQRGFRIHNRLNLTAQIDANNVLNHVAFTSWSTAVGTPQFGTAQTANQMRKVTITLRMRY